MTDRVRNETDYSKYVCESDPHTQKASGAESAAPLASGVGPRAPAQATAESSEGSRALARQASKPPGCVAAARSAVTVGASGSTSAKTGPVSAKLETGAKASVGTDNPDGSKGVHAGASAGASAEVTLRSESGDTSFTVGGSAGPGVGASFGVRDVNQDGKTEMCGSVTHGWLTVAGCAPTQAPPPVAGARGASGTEHLAPTSGSGGASGY